MADRPTPSDLIVWLGLGTQLNDQDQSALSDAVDTAIEAIEGRVSYADVYPTPIRLAVMMTAARLYKRRGTPEGYTPGGELGVIRVSSIDQDVEALIDPYLTLTGFF